MASHRRLKGEPTPVYGPDDDEFSVEVRHGGFFLGSGKDQVNLDGKVDWFDHIKEKYWRFFAIDEISVMLGCGLENVNVYWLLPEMDVPTGLRIVDSDAEIEIMKQFAYKVKNFVLYFDLYNSFDDKGWEDFEQSCTAATVDKLVITQLPVQQKRQANQLLRKPKGQLLLLQLSQTNNQVMKKIPRR